MGGFGAPSPGMVFVEKPVRFTPIVEWYRRFARGIYSLPIKNKQRGALAGQIRLLGKAPMWIPMVQFFMDL